MDVWSSGFKFIQELAQLKENAKGCDLCGLFYQKALESNPTGETTIEFHRVESAFKRGPNGLPVISIYADPGMCRYKFAWITRAMDGELNDSRRFPDRAAAPRAARAA